MREASVITTLLPPRQSQLIQLRNGNLRIPQHDHQHQEAHQASSDVLHYDLPEAALTAALRRGPLTHEGKRECLLRSEIAALARALCNKDRKFARRDLNLAWFVFFRAFLTLGRGSLCGVDRLEREPD
jgi:hypothetical protein